MTSAPQASVAFSRTQGIRSATALGGSAVLGVILFAGGAELVAACGSDAPLVFFIAGLLYLPLIFSCVQRSSGTFSHGGFYGAARGSGSALRLFVTSWFMLGGYLALGALLARAAAVRIDLGVQQLFGFQVGTALVAVFLVAAAFLKEVFSRGEGWRSRTLIFWSCASLLFVLVCWAGIAHYRAGLKLPVIEPLEHWLLALSMLAASLWGVDLVLNYRGQFRRPNRTIGWSLVVIFFGGNLLGALIAIEILRNPALLMRNWLAALTWNETRLELLVLAAGVLVCVSGLSRVMTRTTRLVGAMIVDGALPSFDSRRKTVTYFSALVCALLASGAVSLSTRLLLLLSGFSALLTVILYLQPLVKRDTSRVASLTLPLHPLIPVSAIVLSVFLIWILPYRDLLAGGIWLIAGALLYAAVARKKILPAMQQENVLAGGEVKPSTAGYRVLVCLSGGELHEGLVRIGSAVAAAKNGELVVLRIRETSELLPATVQREQGRHEWEKVQDALQRLALPGPAPVPVVRMAPDLISGVKATLREYPVDFVLLEWPKEPVARLRRNELQGLLQLTPRPVGILKGGITAPPGCMSVACGSSEHAMFALQLSEAIAIGCGCEVEALRIFTKAQSSEAANEVVRESIRQSGVSHPMEIVLREEADVGSGILKHSEDCDLLLVGASDDPLSGRPLPDGHSMDIATQRKKPTLIVKGREEPSTFLLHRVLAHLTNRVTALTPKERSELLANLKVGLQARTDFYLMVALAAAIAIVGLIMNDGSVVLGAMLVSPLMSPIVGIACGTALGNRDLIRRSGASTFRGMALVLGVAVVVTFVLPFVEPTDQILARTHPGIFDLLAALAAGAAGAYSLGRKTVAGALPGVAMSLSLEPPLATAGYGLSTSQFWITGGAFLLFLTNLAAIVLSGVAVYLLLGMRPPKKEGLSVVGRSALSVVVLTAILVVPLAFGTYGSVRKGHLKYQVEAQFRDEALKQRFELLDLKIAETENGFLIHPTVMALEEVTPEKIEKFRKALERKVGSKIQIEATVLQTKHIESPVQKSDGKAGKNLREQQEMDR